MSTDQTGAGEVLGTEDEVESALRLVVQALDGEHRPGQLALAQQVARTLAGGDHALVQAGTGTGKSMGYLVPAALQAVRTGRPVVVATATLALQRQLVERDLPRLADALAPVLTRPLRFAVLKGRNNYVCLNKVHGFVPEDEQEALFSAPRSALGEQAVAVRAWAEETETGDRDDYPDEIDPRVWRSLSVGRRECVGEQRCAHGEACFTVLRRQQAMAADIVITNHAMLAIDAIEGIPVLPEHDAVIIDEGHELVDRVTTAAAVELSVGQIERATRRARSVLSAETLQALDAAAEQLALSLDEVLQGGEGPLRLSEPHRALTLALSGVRDASRAGISELGGSREGQDADDLAQRQHARAAVEELFETAGRILAAGPEAVLWLDASESRAPSLRMAPMAVDALLRDSLFSRNPVLLTSATLTTGASFDSALSALGLTTDDAATIDVGSPFDYATQGILYVPADLPAPGRDGVAEEALDELALLIEAAGGRTLALFSSWRGVERAAEYLRVRLDAERIPLLVQRRGDAVGVLVERFAAEPASCLLGTLSLWQGVDVPGPSCVLVVIDRIPFPRPDDPLLAARQEAVEQAGGSGFRSVSLPRAGLLLAQGAGRLIRGPQDRGVVAVLDSRLATAGYGRQLRASLPPFWYTTDRDTVLGALQRLAEAAEEGRWSQ